MAFKYGKPSWRLVLEAVNNFGGSASGSQITAFIVEKIPTFKEKNVNPDVQLLAVNSYSRANFSPNIKPRRTDEGNEYDALFIDRSVKPVQYTLYDREKHGIWELASVPNDLKLRPRLLREAELEREFSKVVAEAESNRNFDAHSEEDARNEIYRQIVQRQGQAKFRAQLITAYGARCAITGCDLIESLEAAHIKPYLGVHTNSVNNGLLLRADIHTLFDLGLIRINPGDMTVVLAAKVQESQYKLIAGLRIRLPNDSSLHPDIEALRLHGERSIAF